MFFVLSFYLFLFIHLCIYFECCERTWLDRNPLLDLSLLYYVVKTKKMIWQKFQRLLLKSDALKNIPDLVLCLKSTWIMQCKYCQAELKIDVYIELKRCKVTVFSGCRESNSNVSFFSVCLIDCSLFIIFLCIYFSKYIMRGSFKHHMEL